MISTGRAGQLSCVVSLTTSHATTIVWHHHHQPWNTTLVSERSSLRNIELFTHTPSSEPNTAREVRATTAQPPRINPSPVRGISSLLFTAPLHGIEHYHQPDTFMGGLDCPIYDPMSQYELYTTYARYRTALRGFRGRLAAMHERCSSFPHAARRTPTAPHPHSSKT